MIQHHRRRHYPLNGEVAIGSIDHHLGEIALHEILYAPMNVTAVVNDAGDAVNLTWQAPNSKLRKWSRALKAPFPAG